MSVLSSSLHRDLTLNCDGQVSSCRPASWDGLLLYIAPDLAVTSQVRHVTSAPSFFGNASLNWRREGCLREHRVTKVIVVSAYYAQTLPLTALREAPSPTHTRPSEIQGKGASPHPIPSAYLPGLGAYIFLSLHGNAGSVTVGKCPGTGGREGKRPALLVPAVPTHLLTL